MKVITSIIGLLLTCSLNSFSQSKGTKDSVIYNFTYRDTIIYRYDTVKIRRFVYTDTLWTRPAESTPPVEPKRKGLINPNNWGIGPSVGAYYSPYNGFDINIGFGIQYYLLAIPSFRNPHLGKRRSK